MLRVCLTVSVLALLALVAVDVDAARTYDAPTPRETKALALTEQVKNDNAMALVVRPAEDLAAVQVSASSLSKAQRRENRARSNAVSICMNVLDEDIDIADMKRLETGIAEAIAETKEKLKTHKKSRFLNAKLKCLKKARKFHGKALKTISHHVAHAKSIEKEADKCEVDLLNLPCDLDEGDHVDKCDALKCKKKGLRKRERNAKQQARLWYRIQTLDRRIHRFKQHIAKIKETKSCPRRRVDVYNHVAPSLMEVEANALRGGRGFTKWEEDWVICLDRAEARVDQIRRQIARMTAKAEKLKGLAFPLTCGDKVKPKVHYPPACPKPKIPPPPPLPKKYKHKHGRFGFATATASGDPHVDTFDGVHHDTMISGWFTWVKNPVITVQAYSQLGCMPVSIPNTCLRAMSMKIQPPGSDEWLSVSWGLWPPQGHVQNVIISDSFGRNVNQHPNHFRPGLYLGDKFRVSYQHGQLHIRPHGRSITDPNLAVSLVFGAYYMVVTIPRAAPHIGNTNGLFGYINPPNVPRHSQHVLRYFDGRPSRVTQRALCQRCGWGGMQTPEIFEWAATHVVTGPKGINPPISVHQGSLKQTRFLNGHHRNRVHNALIQLNATAAQAAYDEEMALVEVEFDPNPQGGKPKMFPSVVPKANRDDLQYCRLRLKKVFNLDKLKKAKKAATKKPWWAGKKCLSDAEYKKVKAIVDAQNAKVKKAVAKYHESLNACLQDVKSKAVAKTVIKGQKSAGKEKAKQKEKQKKAILKVRAKARAIKRAIKAQKKAEQDAQDPNKVGAAAAKEREEEKEDKPAEKINVVVPVAKPVHKHSWQKAVDAGAPAPDTTPGNMVVMVTHEKGDDDDDEDDDDDDKKSRRRRNRRRRNRRSRRNRSLIEHSVETEVEAPTEGEMQLDQSFGSVDEAGAYYGNLAANQPQME